MDNVAERSVCGNALFRRFSLFGSETAGQCEQNLAIALATCAALGVPVAHHKIIPAIFL